MRAISKRFCSEILSYTCFEEYYFFFLNTCSHTPACWNAQHTSHAHKLCAENTSLCIRCSLNSSTWKTLIDFALTSMDSFTHIHLWFADVRLFTSGIWHKFYMLSFFLFHREIVSNELILIFFLSSSYSFSSSPALKCNKHEKVCYAPISAKRGCQASNWNWNWKCH